MLDKRILFIGNKGSFLMTTIISALEKDGYQVRQCGYLVQDISSMAGSVSAYFVVVEEDRESQAVEAIRSVEELCQTTNKGIFLMGSAQSIERVVKTVGEGFLWGQFPRPINPKEVLEKIEERFAGDVKQDLKKEILVVDDSGTFLLNVKRWLEPSYKVQVVNSALNGILFLGKRFPDLILLDYEMPVCSGPQMLQMLRADERYAQIPVIFLTGKGDRESIGRVLELKPEGYLLKSLPPDRILDSVDQFFARRVP